MYLKKRTVVVMVPNSFEPNRKNLAVHVSLSSYLHNVKEQTLVNTNVGEGGALEFCRTLITSGCPAALVPFAGSSNSGSS